MAALVLPASSFKGINMRCVDTIWVPGRRGNCSDFKTMCVTKCKVVRCQCLTCFWPMPFVSDGSGVRPSDLLLSVQRKLANRAASMSAIWLSRSKYILFVRMLAFLLKVARSGAEKQLRALVKRATVQVPPRALLLRPEQDQRHPCPDLQACGAQHGCLECCLGTVGQTCVLST